MDKLKKKNRYQRIYKQLQTLIEPHDNYIAAMATINAVLYHKFDYYFWTGFYLLKDGDLIVGPYQGPVACIKLKRDAGVCWAGINQDKTIIVPDVHQFPGHIACSSASVSEIVVPLFNYNNTFFGVLDIDSSSEGTFDQDDQKYLEQIAQIITNSL